MPQDAHKKAILTETPNSSGTPQVHFDDKPFADMISDKGYECMIERALRCPCVQISTGGGLSDCMNCGGSGWFFIDKQKTNLAVMSMANRNKYKEWTQENAGTISISARPEDKLGFMDRLTFTELERWHSQILRFYKNIADNTVFAFCNYFPIHVFQMYMYATSNSQLVRIPPVDITVTDNQIQLPLGTYGALVDGGLTCTTRFTHNPQYFVLDINRDLIKQKTKVPCDTGIATKKNLPINCIGRLAHYVLDAPNFNGLGLFDNTDYAKVQNYNL